MVFILRGNTLPYNLPSKEHQTNMIQRHRALIAGDADLDKLPKGLDHSLERHIEVLVNMRHRCDDGIVCELVVFNSLKISGVDNFLCTECFYTLNTLLGLLSGEGSYSASHGFTKLDTEVTQTADSDNSDFISRSCVAVQGSEECSTSTEQGSGFFAPEFFWKVEAPLLFALIMSIVSSEYW